ncbi:MAG: hypothetical protein NXI04_26795 [Planctomycetaceae bacterium]|nr:hypothetical protein [Planctomycetaceae bacterium]
MSSRFPSSRSVCLAWIAACLLATFLLTAALEYDRISTAISDGLSPLAAISFWDFETTIPTLLLGLLPLLFMAAGRQTPGQAPSATQTKSARSPGLPPSFVVIIATISIAGSAVIGYTRIPTGPTFDSEIAFCELPFAYHDEYSYQLQAETFAAGRLSWPACEQFPDLFHQIHVRNQPRTVSRYFPTTGAWVAIFLPTGLPIAGHWLAGAMAACLFAASAARVASRRIGLACGLLLAVSPGIAVFSNLLLAHHPTLLCLSTFLYAYVRLKTDPSRRRWPFVAGTALTLAMLARPMTAAGFALPFGVDLLITIIRNPHARQTIIGFAVPLLAGFAALAVLNHDATGSPFSSAYQSYTDEFTPRHRFGFNNAVNTSASAGPPALQKYDEWATNLTPTAAINNVASRLMASFQWTLARVPLLLGLLLVLPTLWSRAASDLLTPAAGIHAERPDHVSCRWLVTLLLSAFVCLHLVHIPYWFDGILHWHYVFETAPLLIMLATLGWTIAAEQLSGRLGKTARLWVCAMILGGLLPGWIRLPMFQNTSKVSAAVSEQSFSRLRMHQFRQQTHAASIERPALILVDESDSDPQLSYIINPPDYDTDVLVCRLPDSAERLAQVKTAFADRTCYVFDPGSMTVRPLGD